MAEDPKPGAKGAEATGEEEEAAPRPGYIPRPPSQADLDRVSEAQGLITDEWAGEAPPEGGGDGARDRAAAEPEDAENSSGKEA